MATVNFGNTAFEGALEPGDKVVEPVRDNSGLYLAEGAVAAFNDVNKAVEVSIPLFGAAFKAEQTAKSNGILNTYQQEVLRIADAVDQGSINPPAARMRLRALNSQYVANNPTILKDINDLHAKLVSTAGLGDIAVDGNEDYQRYKKLADDAVSGGWISNGVSLEQGVANMQAAQRRGLVLKEATDKLELMKAQNGMVTEGQKFQVTNALKDFVLSTQPWVQSQIEQARAAVSAGGNKGDIVLNLRTKVGEQLSIIGPLKAAGAEGDLSYLTSSVDKQLQNFEDWTTGKYTTDQYEARSKQITAQNELAIMTNSTLGPLISASKMIGNADVILTNRISEAVVDMFGVNLDFNTDENGAISFTQKPADVVGSEKEVKEVLSYARNAMQNSITTGDADTTKEAGVWISNALRGVKQYSASANATDFNAVIEFFADPTVGQYSEINGGFIPKDSRDNANQVIQKQYADVLIPLIRSEYDNAIKYVNERIPELASTFDVQMRTEVENISEIEIDKVIEPFWNGTGVEFRLNPKAGVGLENNMIIQSAIQDLNSGPTSIATPLNNLIRASAHINGNRDYQKTYEKDFVSNLWGNGENEKGDISMVVDPLSVSNPKGLKVNDFNSNELETAIRETSARDPDALIAATNPLEVAQAYLGMGESDSEEVKVLSEFIKRTTGQDVNPVTTAWCAAFVDAVLHSVKSKGTGRLNARSYLGWGVDVDDSPQVGDVVILQRGGPDSWKGHVGFYMGTDESGKVKVLGGNTSDSVDVGTYDPKLVLGFRRAGKA